MYDAMNYAKMKAEKEEGLTHDTKIQKLKDEFEERLLQQQQQIESQQQLIQEQKVDHENFEGMK